MRHRAIGQIVEWGRVGGGGVAMGSETEEPGCTGTRVSSETSFVSKQPKLVSALSETRRLFRLFRFNIETGSFGVSKLFRITVEAAESR